MEAGTVARDAIWTRKMASRLTQQRIAPVQIKKVCLYPHGRKENWYVLVRSKSEAKVRQKCIDIHRRWHFTKFHHRCRQALHLRRQGHQHFNNPVICMTKLVVGVEIFVPRACTCSVAPE